MSPPPVIGICTDSTSQLPAALAERFAVEVVPVTVSVDGVDELDSDELCSDAFARRFSGEHRPVIEVVAPSPGQFAAAYEALLERGCTGILSIHGTGSGQPTLTAARLAARCVPVPVKAVDSGLDDFGISCAVWAAAQSIADSPTLDDAAAHVEHVAPTVGNVVVTGVTNAGVHLGHTLPVVTLRSGNVELLERLETAAEAVNAMAAFAVGFGQRLRIGVGHADHGSRPVADALEAALGEAANVLEVVRFRMGASAKLGPGAVSCWLLPA